MVRNLLVINKHYCAKQCYEAAMCEDEDSQLLVREGWGMETTLSSHRSGTVPSQFSAAYVVRHEANDVVV